jgi:hypothetical protein
MNVESPFYFDFGIPERNNMRLAQELHDFVDEPTPGKVNHCLQLDAKRRLRNATEKGKTGEIAEPLRVLPYRSCGIFLSLK